MQEVRVKRDCARTNEEFSACDLPNVRKKMPAPVDVLVMLPICILLSCTGFAELYQELRTRCVPDVYHMRTICVPNAYHMRIICVNTLCPVR